jgi:hypothetical protein
MADPVSWTLVATLIGAASAATGAGIAIDKAVTAPSQGDIERQQQQQQAAQAQAGKNQQTKAAVAGVEQGMPSLQSNTGGATSPEYNASVVGSGSGVGDPNVLQTAIHNWLGIGTGDGSGGGGGSTPQSPGMFPNAAVPAFSSLQQPGGDQSGLSGGSQ